MRTVMVVGAGATLAEAMPSHPGRDRSPPLDTTFFTLCRLAKLEGRQSVQNYLLRSFGINPFEGEHRMEETFNYIYSQAFADDAPDDCLDAYWSLLRMYAAAIARTTNDLTGTSRGGVGAMIRRLWRLDPGGHLAIVTFNQDLVIEKALESATSLQRYSAIPWSLRNCYGVEFQDYLYAANAGTTFVADDKPSVRVLKLHGSLNWFYTVRSGADPRNSVRSAGGRLHCLANRRILSGLAVKVEKQRRDIIPLIVPPIYEKNSRYGRAVGALWALAADEIEQADRLVVFGYSFPDADFAARSLLRGAFHRNPRLDHVSVVDISAGIAARVADILGAESTAHFRTVPAFVTGN